MKTFTEASSEVIHLAEDLIRKYHPRLEDARIAIAFQDEATKKNGRLELANTSKVQPKSQPFMEYDFLVVVAEDEWTDLSSNAREALIDHELSHMGGNSSDGWKIRHHDIEEFREVLERHGAWNAGLSEDLRSIMQPGLPGTVDDHAEHDKGTVGTLTGRQLGLLSKKVSVIRKVTALRDELLDEARKIKAEEGNISISILQRKLRIGYPKAASLMNLIETAEAANEPS